MKNKNLSNEDNSKKHSSIYYLIELFLTFFKIGSVTFGGGLAMLPILERELSTNRKWTTKDELLDYYAISQSTPGVIAVNVATFIGYKQRGLLGGIFATLGVVTPSIIIISVIANFISNFEQYVVVQKAMKGINVAVAALLTYAVVGFARKTICSWLTALVYCVAFILVFFFNVSSVYVILSSAVIGIVIGLCSGAVKFNKKNRRNDK